MRVVFMGTPEFAVPTLLALVAADFDVVAVYSQPPRPKGRGYEVIHSPVHQAALDLKIPVLTPVSLKDIQIQEELRRLAPDVIVVAAYGLILPQDVLEIPRHGCLNVHGSLLPRWRGAAPIQRALLAGDGETGVAIMQMEAGLDTGPVYRMVQTPIDGETTARHLQDALSHLGAQALVLTIQEIQTGRITPPSPQPEEGVTYAHKLTHEEGQIDWRRSAVEIDRSIRALNPWPGTFTFYQGARIKVYQAKLLPLHQTGIPPGTVLDDCLLIACGEGALQLLELQKPGGKILSARDFLNGISIPKGSQLIDHAPL